MYSPEEPRLPFDSRIAAQAARYPEFYAGRVASQSRELYRVLCETGELLAQVSGKFRYEAAEPSHFPAVGDYVLLDRDADAHGNGVIHHVLPRKSVFLRAAAGTAHESQVVAANIDTVFLCMALNSDFNLRRLERYLSIAWDSGAVPVVVLTKADLCEELERRLAEVHEVSAGTQVLVTSAREEDGWRALEPYLGFGQTVAFLGSSGVGKTTLINRLLGQERFHTQEIRGDDKGRHTTTRRELAVLPGGAAVIDTPGMREVGVERADLSKAFSEIDAWAAQCRFRDCTHTGEPGCAVLGAVRSGELSEDRLASYRKLQKEAKYDGLNARQIENEKITEMVGGLGAMKQIRKYVKEKNRQRGR